MKNIDEKIRIMNKIKLYQCKICDKKFARQWNVKNHMKVHAKRRAKKDCFYCDESFYSDANRRLFTQYGKLLLYFFL